MVRHTSWPTNLAGFQRKHLQDHRCYHIRKKATSASHGYGASENHAQEKEAQLMTVGALQALACAVMQYMEAMANLSSINLTLSRRITQAQETI